MSLTISTSPASRSWRPGKPAVTAAEHSTNGRPAGSPRSRLARVALEAVIGMPEIAVGVRGARAVWATVDAGEMLEGVVATARPDERFDIELHLVAQWPFGSLFTLGDQIRAGVHGATSRAKLDGILGEVTVAFEDVREASSEEVVG